MKSFRIALLAALVVMLGAGVLFAMQHEASVEKGKALFNDPKLGTTGKSCNDCHPNGKGTEESGAKADLPRIVNACITASIKGKEIDEKSMEMQSMVMYIKSLGTGGKPAKKKAAVGC